MTRNIHPLLIAGTVLVFFFLVGPLVIVLGAALSDTTYLIITKAERGSVFTVHTGPLPTPDHAVCFASTNNPGFKECVEEYYHNAGGVAIQSNEAGWWATPL